MAAERKSFAAPDEVREFPKGRLELIKVAGATIGRTVLQPGWRWSTSVKPIARTMSCESPHFQYHVAGTLMVQMDDGTRFECKPGDFTSLPSGHDAWWSAMSRWSWSIFREWSTTPSRGDVPMQSLP